ncbi:MAG: hypothetical protein DRR19_21070 [Candidatus Parabeggiatoa sp. nov. 1]|nr:MAG: hypothetical protein DRR19_21070 [Gammaproteobacteria bacterium]
MTVTKKRFDIDAAEILDKYTHQLPNYFDKLAQLPDILFYFMKEVALRSRAENHDSPNPFHSLIG